MLALWTNTCWKSIIKTHFLKMLLFLWRVILTCLGEILECRSFKMAKHLWKSCGVNDCFGIMKKMQNKKLFISLFSSFCYIETSKLIFTGNQLIVFYIIDSSAKGRFNIACSCFCMLETYMQDICRYTRHGL